MQKLCQLHTFGHQCVKNKINYKRFCNTVNNKIFVLHVPEAGGMNCRTMNLAERESLALNDNLRIILL
jgi:hypothetical protein